MRQADENVEVDQAVHVGTGALDVALQRVHRPCDMLLERIRHEDMIVLGITVIGAGAGKVVDPAVRVAASAARCIPNGCVLGWASRCLRPRRCLLSKQFGHTAQESSERRDSAEEIASSIVSHGVSPSLLVNPVALFYFVVRDISCALAALFGGVSTKHDNGSLWQGVSHIHAALYRGF